MIPSESARLTFSADHDLPTSVIVFAVKSPRLTCLPCNGNTSPDPITLYVYAGADGEFTLYEDDGLTCGYERGAFARMPLRWDDSTRTLSIGSRQGTFPGMLDRRTFEVVLVSKDKPVGFSFTPKPTTSISYEGRAVKARFN